MRQLVSGFAASEDSDEEDEDGGAAGPGKLAILFACLRTFNLNLSLSDLEGTGLEALFAWDNHKSIILELFADIATQPFVGTHCSPVVLCYATQLSCA